MASGGNNFNDFYHFSEKQLTKTSSLSQNPQEAVIATIICFLTNFTELEITKIQANYWWGQMYCGPPNQNFGCAIAHPAHTLVPHVLVRGVISLHTLPVATNQAFGILPSVPQYSSQPFSSYGELFVKSRQF